MIWNRCGLVLLLLALVAVDAPGSHASEEDTPGPAPDLLVRSEAGAPVEDARILPLTLLDTFLPVGHGLFPGRLSTEFPLPAGTSEPVPALYEVRAPGFAPGYVGAHSFAGHARRPVVLEPGLTARVMLVDQAGNALPVDGAFACLAPTYAGVNAGVVTHFNWERSRWSPITGTPDPEGGFSLRDLPSGWVHLGVRLNPTTVLLRRVPLWRSGQEFYFREPATGHLSGLVTSASGEPVPGCHVLCRLTVSSGTQAMVTGMTNETGSFRIEVPAGRLMRTEFFARGHGSTHQSPKPRGKPRELPPGKELTVNASLPGERILSGRLVAAGSGKPVAGMVVLARCEPSGGRASAMPLAVSDPDGRFCIRGLAPGQVALRGMSTTHCLPPQTISLTAAPDTTVTLEVPPPGALHGVLLNSRGGPAPFVSVSVRQSNQVVNTLRTGPDGKFKVMRLPAGTAELSFMTPDYLGPRQRVLADIPVAGGEVIRKEGTAIPIDIFAGQDHGPIRVRAPDLVVLGGRAVGDDGRGIPGARFLVQRGHDSLCLPASRDSIFTLGTTGPDGRFNLTLPGSWLETEQVCLFQPGRTVAQFREGGEDLEVRLSRGRRLVGTVLDRRKRSVWGSRLSLRMKYGRETHGTWKQHGTYQVETDLRGQFELSGLSAGEYRLDGRPKFGHVDFRIDGDLKRDFVLEPK